ncbi:hypothetical protein SAMN05444673_5984 [Bacillus sp. OV166]|nr:hypothetical protein SAMN05444673_5984 [Bacillus sp. OV166]
MLKEIVDFIAKLIGAEGAKTPAGGRGRGGSPDRPRTARAWSGNQHPSITKPYFLKKQGILESEFVDVMAMGKLL